VVINEVQALALLDEVNPVPDMESYAVPEADIAAYLATLQQGSSEMTQVETRPTEEARPRRSRLIAVTAILLVIVGTAVFLLIRPGQEASVATQLQPPTTDSAVMAVMDAIDAYNRGDIEAYVAVHATNRDAGPRWWYGGEFRYLAEVWMNASRQVTVVEPCQVTKDTFPKRVECLIALEDDWLGPAGLNKTERFAFRVNSDLRISSDFVGERGGPVEGLVYPVEDEDWSRWEVAEIEYAVAFWKWLEQEHPDVYTKIKPAGRTGNGSGVDGHLPGEGLWQSQSSREGRDPGDMLIALQYVDEFIAQSDDYPIDSSG
jgi:hypothetical protein